MSAFLDTNVLIRHLTGDPPAQARRATAFLERADELLVPDLILAEVVYVLESFYEVGRQRVAELVRAIIAFPAIIVVDEPLLLRALEVYEVERIDFAEAYLVDHDSARRTVLSGHSADRKGSVSRSGWCAHCLVPPTSSDVAQAASRGRVGSGRVARARPVRGQG